MHILLLSANTGEGHNSTSRAIADVLQEKEHSCHILDALSYLSPSFSRFICSSHNRIYRYAPKLFSAGYGMMEKITPYSEELSPIYEILRLGASKLHRRIHAEEYDAVICVHPFSGIMMTEVRKEYHLNIPCYFVATDYTCSPTVEQCRMDGYFIPHEDLASEFTQVGLPRRLLIPAGIPVRQAFYQKEDSLQIRNKLGLPIQDRIILMMAGSLGCGPLERIAKGLHNLLPANTTLVAICGNNEKLRDSLLELRLPRLRVLGYTTQVPAYMDAADIIITKPGGLSSTEAANKHLPIVFINSVGGCESRNFDFFLDRGFALGSTSAEDVIRQAHMLLTDDRLRQQMQQLLSEHFHSNAAIQIADTVCEQAHQYHLTQQSIILEESAHPTSQKGGCLMENQKLTLQNLARAFAGESQARTRYTIYAQQARTEGFEWIARIFEETAANETIHAEEFLEQLQELGGCGDAIELNAAYPFQLGSTADNLSFAASGELEEHSDAYPQFAEIARREGFDQAAHLFTLIARVEGVHHNTFRQLYEQMVSGTLAEKQTPVMWRCVNCGHTYESTRAVESCPICKKGSGWQSGPLDQKQLINGKNR